MTRSKADGIREADLQRQITDLADICGWKWNHTRRSIGHTHAGRKWQTTTSVKGFPDLFMWHPTTQTSFFAELKSQTGKLTHHQAEVIESLRAAGITCYVWRPADWDTEIMPTLTLDQEWSR